MSCQSSAGTVTSRPCFGRGIIVFDGSIVALVTPFDEQDRIDYDALQKLIEFHIGEGTNGLVIAGTTGESATLLNGWQSIRIYSGSRTRPGTWSV